MASACSCVITNQSVAVFHFFPVIHKVLASTLNAAGLWLPAFVCMGVWVDGGVCIPLLLITYNGDMHPVSCIICRYAPHCAMVARRGNCVTKG